jgi:DNA-binding NtrC family response regulator
MIGAGRPGRILVVDDMESMCQLLDALLSERGHEVRTTTTGAQALAAAQDFDCQVAVVDYRLPDTDGLDLIRKLRTRRPGLRAILMTSYGTRALQESVDANGLCGYMPKPFDNERMIEQIEQAVAAALLETPEAEPHAGGKTDSRGGAVASGTPRPSPS